MTRDALGFARWSDLDYAALQHKFCAVGQQEGTKGDDDLHGRKTDDTIDGLGGDDVIRGRAGDDTLSGSGGDDVLKGAGGTDHLFGGNGNDVLYGGNERQDSPRGSDELNGGSGDDRMYGGYGHDVITGGLGYDYFMYTKLDDSTADNSDDIIDFDQGKDKLVFRGMFRESVELHFIGNTEFSHAPGEVRFLAFPHQGQVQIDIDGDGQADTLIVFASGIQFQASDFSF